MLRRCLDMMFRYDVMSSIWYSETHSCLNHISWIARPLRHQELSQHSDLWSHIWIFEIHTFACMPNELQAQAWQMEQQQGTACAAEVMRPWMIWLKMSLWLKMSQNMPLQRSFWHILTWFFEFLANLYCEQLPCEVHWSYVSDLR